MTGFDNGPKDGDFVRYIDALNAARAAAPQPSNPSQPVAGSSPFDARSTRSDANRGTARVVPTPTLPRPSPTQAKAIAEALLRADGTVGPWRWGSIVALAIGLVLMIAGLVAANFNAVLFAAGAALVYWTVGRWVRRARVGADSPLAAFIAHRR